MIPNNPCCWNKMINREQSTIVFHVYNLKPSHKDVEQVSNIIVKFESIYATIDPMTMHRGKLHHYIGMIMDFRTQREVQITMYDCIRKLINSLPEDMKGSKQTAAPEYLFRTDDEQATKLSIEINVLFHKITAKVLCISKGGRPNLQLVTLFFCTRVQSPDKHDYNSSIR